MRFKTFESLLNNCKDLYDTVCTKDEELSIVFGTNSQITIDWVDTNIDSIISSIQDEYEENGGDVEWLFWESMLNTPDYLDFEIDDVTYEGSPRNIWMQLEGILDERFSKSIPDFNENDIRTHFTKEEIVKAHDTSKLQEDAGILLHPEVTIIDKSQSSKNIPDEETISVTKVQVGHKARELQSEYSIETTQELEIERDENIDDEITELMKDESQKDQLRAVKMFRLRDKQVSLESVKLSSDLEEKLKDDLEDSSITIGSFVISLVEEFNSLKTKAKYKNLLNRIEGSFRMVLASMIKNRVSMKLANFEVSKVLNNLKQEGSILNYTVTNNNDLNTIVVGIIFSDINEKPTIINLILGKKLKITIV